MSLSHLETAFKADIPMKHKYVLLHLAYASDCYGFVCDFVFLIRSKLSQKATDSSIKYLSKRGFIDICEISKKIKFRKSK